VRISSISDKAGVVERKKDVSNYEGWGEKPMIFLDLIKRWLGTLGSTDQKDTVKKKKKGTKRVSPKIVDTSKIKISLEFGYGRAFE